VVNRSLVRRVLLVSALASLALSAVAQSPFMRLSKPSKTVEVLQTKARKYSPAGGAGPDIWLVGVAHVGRTEYYKQIEKLLDEQTTVLYEGVTKKGTDPVKADDSKKMSSTYQVLSDTLGLQFQLFAIDYKKPSFRNSDLSWEELNEIESKVPKGASTGMNLTSIGNALDSSSEQGKQLASVMGMIKNDPSSCEAMRLFMIETLSNPSAIDMAMPASLSDLLIKKRNAKVLADLKTEVANKPKSIAIFFGAGHMADMEKHLTADFNYKPGEERWFSAIQGDTSKVSGQGQLMLDTMRSMMAARKKPPTGKGGSRG
jgi:hypothetical protein